MKVGILHVSDLHRDRSSQLRNGALLESLLSDISRCTEEMDVRRPDVVVVSGDIIQGVSATASNADMDIERQYVEAESFLRSLSDELLGGSRERVVLIPGNHDVHFPRVLASLKPLSSTDPGTTATYVDRLQDPTTELRWSWRDMAFSAIEDRRLYESRLQHFAEFYERFYDHDRSYSTLPEGQIDFFDYADLNISIAALSSCYNNDPIHTAGSIHPDCIARAGAEFRKPQYSGRVLLATYHHSTSGPPLRVDYMDSDVLQNLMDYGVVLTMHGHQHRAEVVDQRFTLGGQRRIAMVSAATLCGGPNTLPAGEARGYNLLEIDTERPSVRICPRKMYNQSFAAPVWGPALTISGESSIEVQLDPPRDTTATQTRSVVARAEQMIGRKEFRQAIALLEPVRQEPLARRLLLAAVSEVDDSRLLVDLFYPPRSLSEAIHVAGALWDEHETVKLRTLLLSPLIALSDEAAAREVRERYSSRV